jgi:NADPH2 dehydrogenase
MSSHTAYPKIASFKTVVDFRRHVTQLALSVPVDDRTLTAREGSPLAEPYELAGRKIGNRWCVQPMEGWDAHLDGSPSELTLRRWRNFGRSGAKLVWGGEAAAIEPAGRANPKQTLATAGNCAGLRALLTALEQAHTAAHGTTDDLVVGLQLTHAGRFSHPDSHSEPRIAFHHPLLDAKFGLDPADSALVLSDAEAERLIDAFVAAAGVAADAGFQLVDVKACHGYLLHEFLSARDRPGKFGGDLAGRSRMLREIVTRIRSDYPRLIVGVRLSLFDCVPYANHSQGNGPWPHTDQLPYRWGFGVSSANPLQSDRAEPLELVRALAGWGVAALNVSGGSPYYSPHLVRPATFPPADGYTPPEDPLAGVARHLAAAQEAKLAAPELLVVGSGFSYLQDFLPHVAQAVVRAGWFDCVGLGRMMLAYPDLPADVLQHGQLTRPRICRTFSDCTTAPRAGLVSGCFPLDPFYRVLDDAQALRAAKADNGRP